MSFVLSGGLFSFSGCSSGPKTQTEIGSPSDSEEAEKKGKIIYAGLFLLVFLWVQLYFSHEDPIGKKHLNHGNHSIKMDAPFLG